MTSTRSVIVERDIPHPPEKIWRALTQPHLIQEWLMKNDFKPAIDHQFRFSADWGGVDCKVLTVEPNKTLSYTWVAMGLESVVTWTLTPEGAGTHLRMEHAGFPTDKQQAYMGAMHGWRQFIGKLEALLEKQA
jgi:uncharacterized protein YndB with AHSA1/START domain